jgi:hypothetical protein
MTDRSPLGGRVLRTGSPHTSTRAGVPDHGEDADELDVADGSRPGGKETCRRPALQLSACRLNSQLGVVRSVSAQIRKTLR